MFGDLQRLRRACMGKGGGGSSSHKLDQFFRLEGGAVAEINEVQVE